MEELVSLDDEELNLIKPVYGLILLFKWVPEKEPRPVQEYYDEKLFFAE